jgi:hypothetical protein
VRVLLFLAETVELSLGWPSGRPVMVTRPESFTALPRRAGGALAELLAKRKNAKL